MIRIINGLWFRLCCANERQIFREEDEVSFLSLYRSHMLCVADNCRLLVYLCVCVRVWNAVIGIQQFTRQIRFHYA